MAPTRALFASIGASVTLVCAAALSLLAVSAVFAFGGWSTSSSGSNQMPAIVFAGVPVASAGSELAAGTGQVASGPLVVRAPVRTATRREGARSGANATGAADRSAAPRLRSGSSRGSGNPIAVAPPPPAAPAAVKQKTTGDHVRKAGDTLSTTVQDTGTALAEAAQPLAPPVSSAVQQVLNVVAELVRRATGGLGGTLDTLLPPR